jgi:hypothetical protein
MRRLVKPDPLTVLIGGIVIVCGVLGVFDRAELTADQVAILETGIIMMASSIRMWINRARGVAEEPVYGPTDSTDAG